MDFEEQLRVIRVDERKFVGAHPLKLPMAGARGVFGGNTIGQTLLVAIESTKHATDGYVWTPTSFHVYFIRAGDSRVPMEYEVDSFEGPDGTVSRAIVAIQKGKVRATASCKFVRSGQGLVDTAGPPPPPLSLKYPNPSKLYQSHHSGYIRNAFSKEFMDYHLTPEEDQLPASERTVTVWNAINNRASPKYRGKERALTRRVPRPPAPKVPKDNFPSPSSYYLPPKFQQSVENPVYNFVGLAVVSDSFLLTTLPRVLHVPWNPTEYHSAEEFDASRDARLLMKHSMNIIHLYHYNAMSLDHHIYFHTDVMASGFDVVKDWLCFQYRFKRHGNSRTLVEGHFFNKENKAVATVVQEGLTYLFKGFADEAKL